MSSVECIPFGVEFKTIKNNVKDLFLKIGVPAEVYNYGITYVWWGIAACVATVVSGRSQIKLNTSKNVKN